MALPEAHVRESRRRLNGKAFTAVKFGDRSRGERAGHIVVARCCVISGNGGVVNDGGAARDEVQAAAESGRLDEMLAA